MQDRLERVLEAVPVEAGRAVARLLTTLAADLRRRQVLHEAERRRYRRAQRAIDAARAAGYEAERRERLARDLRVMQLAAKGWSNRRIAEEVGVGRSTVARAIRRCLRFDPYPPPPFDPALPDRAPPELASGPVNPVP